MDAERVIGWVLGCAPDYNWTCQTTAWVLNGFTKTKYAV